MKRGLLLLLAISLSGSGAFAAAPQFIQIGVASNFLNVARKIATRFQTVTGVEVRISSASTGALYHQIKNGAPFDVFLSADREIPERLIQEGLARPETRRTYAVGQLVAWTSRSGWTADRIKDAIASGKFKTISMANPKTAPYGKAAQQLLEKLHTVEGVRGFQDLGQIVTGENIAQAFQFAETGNADFGFVAFSQVKQVGKGSFWQVEPEWHSPLVQDAVVLGNAPGVVNGIRFLEYLGSPEIVTMIENAGYRSKATAR